MITIAQKDDLAFVGAVEKLLQSLLLKKNPETVVVVKIDNWFDHKWLNFTGKSWGVIARWNSDLVVPPFNPNRVMEQLTYQRIGDQYKPIDMPALHKRCPSEENQHRKLRHMFSSALLIWWSGNTLVNAHGSIMVYDLTREEHDAWFVSMIRKDQWQIQNTEVISPNEVHQLIT